MAITFKSVLASGGSGATITVTYSSEFYGQTLTATNGTDTVTALATSAGTVDITVPSAGSWVVSCTISGETYTSETVSVDLSYSTELVAIPDGSTVTPTDDVQTWLKCAGIKDKVYTTLSEVLADSVTFNALLGDSNACAYMARSTTWAATLCADQYAMSMIGQYDVCCDALLGNATWASAIVNSAYADYVLNGRGLVPVMTSNTTPSGVASASSFYTSGYEAYKAFDGNFSTLWVTSSGVTNNYVAYEFTSPVKAKLACVHIGIWQTTSGDRTFYIRGTNNPSLSWTNLGSFTIPSGSSGDLSFAVELSTSDNYSHYSMYCADTMHVAGTWSIQVRTVQFYDLEPSGELIHGTTNESAYYLDNGTEVAIVDPSTLSAGTYTFGSTVAKDPSDLTADYTKSIRITPNTVEVVLRPDCALYWWGYEGDTLSVSGYTLYGYSVNSATKNTTNLTLPQGGNAYVGIGTTDSIDTTGAGKIKVIGDTTGNGVAVGAYNSKTINGQSVTRGLAEFTASGLVCVEATLTPDVTNYFLLYRGNPSTQYGNIYALWYE
jgi:hypothetical protein